MGEAKDLVGAALFLCSDHAALRHRCPALRSTAARASDNQLTTDRTTPDGTTQNRRSDATGSGPPFRARSSSPARAASSAARSASAIAHWAPRSAGWTSRPTRRTASSPAISSDPSGWAGHAKGCDLFINTAAVVSLNAPWDLYRNVSVRGARNALDAAIAGGAEALRPLLVGRRAGLGFRGRGRREAPGRDRRGLSLRRGQGRERARRARGARRRARSTARSCVRATSTAPARGRGSSCRCRCAARE